MPHYITLLSCLLITICCTACTTSDTARPDYQCHRKASIIDTVKDKTGILFFDDSLNMHAIRVVPKGTIDEVNIFLLCPLPAHLPGLGSTVSFNGYIRPSTAKADFAGMNFYELEATRLQ